MQRINPRFVTSDGRYSDVENNIFVKLSAEQMKKLYELYPEELESVYKRYSRKRMNVPSYSLKKEKIGKNIKTIVNRSKFVVIIGTLVVSLGAGVGSFLQTPKFEHISAEAIVIDNSNYLAGASDIEEIQEEVVVDDEFEYQMEMSALVEQYCAIYEVDYDKVYRKLCELTDNFNSEDFVQDGHIPGVTCNKKEVYTGNKEMAILVAVRHIKQIPEDFGFTEEELYTGISYESDDSYEMIIAKYADIFGLSEHRNLMYGVYYAETGGNSRLLVEDNNYGGLKYGGKNAKFANSHIGGIEFVITIKKLMEMGYTTPKDLQDIYAPSFENDGEQWIENVKWNTIKAESVYETINEQLAARSK